VTQLGLTVVTGTGLGALAGWGLDRWLGTRPALLVAGMFLGLAGGAWGAYRLVARFLGE
jgi:ATP synthase protein I